MYDLAGEKGLDLEAIRARLRRMSDDALVRLGRAAVCARRPLASGKEPRQCPPGAQVPLTSIGKQS